MRSPIRTNEINNPEKILSNLINDYIKGRLDDSSFLYRVLVTKIDQVGGKLEGPDSSLRKNESPNPKNSIQGRIVTDGADRATPDEELTVFWPLFPYDVMPLKEGEHAYVIFEDNSNKTHGLWLTRIPENKKVDQLNLVPGEKKYKENSENDTNDVGLNKAAQDSELEVNQPTQSEDFSKEEVPDFTARTGDRVIHGSNNTLILLSRDRIDNPTSGEKDSSGTIHLVSGRKDKENLNLKDDQSFVSISAKTDIDNNLSIEAGSASGPSASIAVKSDEIRIVARKGFKVVVENGDIFIKNKGKVNIDASGEVNIKSGSKIVLDAPAVKTGSDGASESHMLGDSFIKALNTFLVTLNSGQIIGGAFGIPGTVNITAEPVGVAATALQAQLALLISKKHKVE